MVTKIIFWEMDNGHKHSFLTDEDDWTEDTTVPHTTHDGNPVKNQGEYYDFIMRSEYTGGKKEIEYMYPEEIEIAIADLSVYYDNTGDLCFF